MLYKKYHRNFVKRFKKGVKFGYGREPEEYVYVVRKEPWCDLTFWNGNPQIRIRIIDSGHGSWILISQNGSIDYNLKVENVI